MRQKGGRVGGEGLGRVSGSTARIGPQVDVAVGLTVSDVCVCVCLPDSKIKYSVFYVYLCSFIIL